MKILCLILLITNSYGASYKLYDEQSVRPLENVSVVIRRENSIRCITDPCPSNQRDYKKTTDKNGTLVINEKHLLEDKNYLILIVKNYHPQRVSKLKSNKVYFTPSSITKEYRKISFIDKSTMEAIKNKDVWFSKSKNCSNKTCDDIVFETKTNELGISYYKFLDIFPKGLAQIEPVYIHIKGFDPYERHHHHRGEALMRR